MGQITQCLDGQRVPLNAVERASMQGPYPYWGVNRVIDYLDRWLFDEDLVLLGEDGAPFFERGREVAFFVTGKIWVNNHAHVLRAHGPIISRFLVCILNSVNYASYVGGATRDKLTQQAMKAIPVQLPPVGEQYKILDWIEGHLQPLLSSIARAQHEIDLIREYRNCLIADVVTGKLDVRGIELPEVDEVEAQEEWEEDTDVEVEGIIDVEEAADADE